MAWKRPWDLFRVSHNLRPLELAPSLLQLFQVPRQGAKQSWAEVPFLPCFGWHIWELEERGDVGATDR